MSVSIAQLKASLRKMADEAEMTLAKTKVEGRDLTKEEAARVDEIIAEIEVAKYQIKRLETEDVGMKVDAIAFGGISGSGLYAEFKSAGWQPGERTYIPDPGFLRVKAASFDGDVPDISPIRREGGELGFDRRYIHPAFPMQAVDGTTTSVQILLQSGRTLASTSDVVRAIDSVTAKPETSSVKTLTTVDLQQVAAIESATPNIILAQPGFRSMVEQDLRTTILEAYDQLVLDAIAGVTPTNTTPGADLVASLRAAIEDLAALGYNGPYTALLSPQDAVDLDLMQSGGPEAFYVFGPGQFARAPFGLNVRIGKNVTDPMVVDPAAFGRLYATGLTLATFEEGAGSTNSSTVRLEGNAAFGVEREAALTIIGGS